MCRAAGPSQPLVPVRSPRSAARVVSWECRATARFASRPRDWDAPALNVRQRPSVAVPGRDTDVTRAALFRPPFSAKSLILFVARPTGIEPVFPP